MSRVAVFASGSGSNAENIVKYFSGRLSSDDFSFYCNNKNAFVNERAKELGVKITLFSREEFYNSDIIVEQLKKEGCEIIVLAGFLWLIPDNLVKAFKGKIINVHPALLPKYGGKGMYGKKVHEAVVENKETESGITIHYVDENYDEGKVIFQASCDITELDSASDVERKVHDLEYLYYPKVIEQLLKLD
ncbi:phosphoribosylglycinamide formyltransferase [Plebeiibacterium sediminum]|uniref:Phosphoribosylglycinamide formyltransferase n=1 Tax=Plebeiibacterium sediminum TaxID=2992112 RepID=A0AAE3M3J4_9BACT|nr:phosphoribosylglycinamide formyltransferase [Plebeiobacterium sediminum]MCW3786532.1 phosphoribosylglycinamide formyltransferase [Plebeiobacterium sediminum]